MALTLSGTTGIVFNDSTSISTAYANNDVLKIASLISNYSTTTPTTIDSTSTAYFVQNYGPSGTVNQGGLGNPVCVLWASSGGTSNGVRGTYFKQAEFYDGTNFVTKTVGINNFYGPIVKNFATTGNMVVNLYCRMYRAADDSMGWKIQYSDNGGAEQLLASSSGTGGTTNGYTVVFNGTVSIPANTVRNFYCYGTISGGNNLDYALLTDFYTTFNSWA